MISVSSPIKVYIGFDQAESIAYHVLCHSINRRASSPVQITPIMLSQLKGVMTRDRHPKQSNEFAFSRFLTPWLSNYEGWSIFIDCDMLFKADIAELWSLRDYRYAVQVVKHNHVPEEKKKYLGTDQHVYDRKNWTSVMLFNNEKCKKLTPKYINEASGLDLHQFRWLEDNDIGEIPKEWNHLVGYDKYNHDVKNIHYTTGGPYFQEYRGCDYTKDWDEEHKDQSYCAQLDPTVRSIK